MLYILSKLSGPRACSYTIVEHPNCCQKDCELLTCQARLISNNLDFLRCWMVEIDKRADLLMINRRKVFYVAKKHAQLLHSHGRWVDDRRLEKKWWYQTFRKNITIFRISGLCSQMFLGVMQTFRFLAWLSFLQIWSIGSIGWLGNLLMC